MAYRTLHQRALIRMAIVRLLKENEQLLQYFGNRIYSNRMEHWLQSELPAMGVYTLSEEWIDNNRSPDPDWRRIELAIEILDGQSTRTDDRLDAFCLMLENALSFENIGNMMGIITNEILEKAEKKAQEKDPKRDNRYPIDTLLAFVHTGTEIGLAVESERQLGVAVLRYEIEYEHPADVKEMPDFLQAYTAWDVYPADGHIDMQSQVKFEPIVDETFLSTRFMQKN